MALRGEQYIIGRRRQQYACYEFPDDKGGQEDTGDDDGDDAALVGLSIRGPASADDTRQQPVRAISTTNPTSIELDPTYGCLN